MEEKPIDPVYELWWLILLTRRAMIKVRSKELSKYGITPAEAGVLTAIKGIGREATNAEISRCLLRESHSISGILDRMEKEGLVKRHKDLKRKNQIRIVLTKKGNKYYQNTLHRESVHRIMSAISREEQEQLRSTLMKLGTRALSELGLDYQAIFAYLSSIRR